MGDLDSQPGQDALMIVNETCKWTEKFYDMDLEDVREYIEMNSSNGIVYIEYNYRQLGKDESWFNEICRVLNNDKMKIKREVLLARLHGSSDSPYEPEDLEAIQELQGTIKEEIFINKFFKLDVYETLLKKQIYFVGVDVAGGYGADNSAITVWDPYTQRTVAEFRSSNIGVKDLIKFIYILVKKYIPRSILFIERNYNGEAVLDHLRDTDIRANLYFDNSKDPTEGLDEKLDPQGFVKVEAAKRKLYGVYTHGKSRELMFDLLAAYVSDHKESFVGQYIIDDLMKLVRTKTGKIEAQKGAHDDNIMSFNMCLYGYYYGNNLSRYGFVKGKIPNEEEANKGMHYEEIYAALSETDRANLGLNENAYEIYQNLDMGKLISEKHGLVSEDELKKELRSDSVKMIKSPNINQVLDPYQQKIYKEMLAAQKESEAFNKRIGFTTGYNSMSEEYDDGIDFDTDLFTELNS